MAMTVWSDLDGTLVAHTTDRSLIKLAATDCGLTIDADAVADYRDFLFQSLRRGQDRPYEQAAALWARHRALDVDPAVFAEHLADRHVTDTVVIEGARTVLETLDDHFTLGMITNGSGDVQRRKLAGHDLADHFETIVISGETPYMKPDDGIFTLAADRLPADQHVYIADRLAYDIVPARENSFHGVWVSEATASTLADVTVSTVADLSVEQLRSLEST